MYIVDGRSLTRSILTGTEFAINSLLTRQLSGLERDWEHLQLVQVSWKEAPGSIAVGAVSCLARYWGQKVRCTKETRVHFVQIIVSCIIIIFQEVLGLGLSSVHKAYHCRGFWLCSPLFLGQFFRTVAFVVVVSWLLAEPEGLQLQTALELTSFYCSLFFFFQFYVHKLGILKMVGTENTVCVQILGWLASQITPPQVLNPLFAPDKNKTHQSVVTIMLLWQKADKRPRPWCWRVILQVPRKFDMGCELSGQISARNMDPCLDSSFGKEKKDRPGIFFRDGCSLLQSTCACDSCLFRLLAMLPKKSHFCHCSAVIAHWLCAIGSSPTLVL